MTGHRRTDRTGSWGGVDGRLAIDGPLCDHSFLACVDRCQPVVLRGRRSSVHSARRSAMRLPTFALRENTALAYAASVIQPCPIAAALGNPMAIRALE